MVELNRINGINGPCLWVLDMLDHSHLFEAPTTRLGSEQEISPGVNTWDKRFIAAVIVVVLVFLVLFVIAAIAVDNSNNDAIDYQCSSFLRYIVIADMVLGLVCLIVLGIIFYPLFDFMDVAGDMADNLFLYLAWASLVLCALSFWVSGEAMNKPQCMSAMRSIGEDKYSSVKGFKSPSADTGWALLAVSGVGFGVFYVFLVGLLCLCIRFYKHPPKK